MRGRDPTSRLAGPPVDQPGNRMYADTIIIIAIKTALWQFSKKSYCVLVHGPRLKSKKLMKCDSRKLKFHTKPHNNHNG